MSNEAAFLEAFKRSSSSSSSSDEAEAESAFGKRRVIATKKSKKNDIFSDQFSMLSSPSASPSPVRKRKLIKPGQVFVSPKATNVVEVSSDESDKENSESDTKLFQPRKKKARAEFAEIDLTSKSPPKQAQVDLTDSALSKAVERAKKKKEEDFDEDNEDKMIHLDFSAEDTDDEYVSCVVKIF